jgi:drug/metabolite transporter (DMT)-like permease
MVVNHIGFTVGLNYTSVSHSSVIVGATPIVVLILAWMMRLERITGRKLFGLGLAFGGAMVLGLEGKSGNAGTGLLGDFLTLAGVVGFSLYTVLGKRVALRYSAVRMTVYNSFWAAFLMLPVACWQAMRIENGAGLQSIRWQGWAAVAYMGAVASATAFLLYFWALKHMTASKLASLNYLQPVGATLLAALLIGERLTLNLVIGAVLILLGVYAIESRSAMEPVSSK